MADHPNAAAIRAAEERSSGDPMSMMDMLDDDIVWHEIGREEPIRGKQALMERFASMPQDGDIKVELYGDGRSFDPDKGGYLATGYVAVMGGWKNSKSQIARLDEHGKDIAARNEPAVEKGKRYHWKLVRKGGRLDWFVDDMTTPFLTLEDPQPLEGAGHEYFAINNWQTDTWFDNLRIAPAP